MPIQTLPAPITNRLVIHTDGGSRGNPGPAATGVVIYGDKQAIIHAFGKHIGIATNNVAEYTAVLHALEWLIQSGLNPESILFNLDSKLVVEQLSGRWKIKDPNLAILANQIKDLTSNFHFPTSYSYVPRSQNAAADAQVNLALDAAILIQ
jgi:probable phosphoglycerate mutase